MINHQLRTYSMHQIHYLVEKRDLFDDEYGCDGSSVTTIEQNKNVELTGWMQKKK